MNKTTYSAFAKHFSHLPQVTAFAPGRVNLIGEHTDYNQGFVFPVALNKGTYVQLSLRDDMQVIAIAKDMDNQENRFYLNDIQFDNDMLWANYVRGVFKQINQHTQRITGVNIYIYGDQPRGAGLSSSASMTVALIKGLVDLFGLEMDGKEAAKIAQATENTFVGCACGIMDHLISALGMKHKALKLDCRNLSVEYGKIPDSLELMVFNSNVKRSLVSSEYNIRREQCESAALKLNTNSLRDVTIEMLESKQDALTDVEFRRARHIVSENIRVEKLYSAFRDNNLAEISQLIRASHVSMRDDFEITIPEIDTLVEIINDALPIVGGARMTGGGFGGCVIALVPKSEVARVEKIVTNKYPQIVNIQPTIYNFTVENGAFNFNNHKVQEAL